jgi:hypothetical protein
MTKRMSMPQTPDDLLREPLQGVCFLMDYIVDLLFNGPILRALTRVEVTQDGQRWVFPEPGSRDALCSVIGATLTGIDIDDERSAILRFDSGHVIVIPLAEQAREGPEAMHFVPGLGRPIQVW